MSDISEIFSSKHCLQVIKQFLYKPYIEKYQTEVVRESGLAYLTAVKCLNTLVTGNLLIESWKGGLKIYSLNRDSPVVKHLKILLDVSTIYESVKDFTGKGFELYIFGSAARGEDTEGSDVDLLIVGTITEHMLVNITERIANVMSREVNSLVKSPIEFAELSRTNAAFYESITRDRVRIL